MAMSYFLPDCPVNRPVLYIVVHCTASKVTTNFTLKDLRHLHVDICHWSDIGYHFYITKDGKIHTCRPMSKIGAHVKGYNRCSIGVCYEGGLNARGRPADTRTPAQKESLIEVLSALKERFPKAKIVGHYELGANKACPCFCASKEYSFL